MTEDERRAIEWDCQQVLNRVANYLDEGRWDELAACYTVDAILARPSDPDNPIRGRADILQSFLARAPRLSCHMLANCIFDVESATRVMAQSRVMLISADAGQGLPTPTNAPLLIGTFTDRLHKVDGQWLIAERQGTIEIKHSD